MNKFSSFKKSLLGKISVFVFIFVFCFLAGHIVKNLFGLSILNLLGIHFVSDLEEQSFVAMVGTPTALWRDLDMLAQGEEIPFVAMVGTPTALQFEYSMSAQGEESDFKESFVAKSLGELDLTRELDFELAAKQLEELNITEEMVLKPITGELKKWSVVAEIDTKEEMVSSSNPMYLIRRFNSFKVKSLKTIESMVDTFLFLLSLVCVFGAFMTGLEKIRLCIKGIFGIIKEASRLRVRIYKKKK